MLKLILKLLRGLYEIYCGFCLVLLAQFVSYPHTCDCSWSFAPPSTYWLLPLGHATRSVSPRPVIYCPFLTFVPGHPYDLTFVTPLGPFPLHGICLSFRTCLMFVYCLTNDNLEVYKKSLGATNLLDEGLALSIIIPDSAVPRYRRIWY